jgi:spermidine synthase
VLFLAGLAPAIAQIVLLRELLVVCGGNEISLGLSLAAWLAWTTMGSAAAGRFAPRLPVAGLAVFGAVAFPCAILTARAARGIFEAGPGAMIVTSLVTLGPYCLTVGVLFVALCARQSPGVVYTLETLGAALGGLLAGLVLLRWLDGFQIALGLGALCLLAAAWLAGGRWAIAPLLLSAAACVMLALGVDRSLTVAARLPTFAPRLLSRDRQGAVSRNSLYGNLAVVESEGSRSVYENGQVLFTAPDLAAAEEAVHYALLQHPAPRAALLIGGGAGGAIAEALRHRTIERLDYVELDPAILDLAREYFPRQWAAIAGDPRVRVHVTDGRLFLKTTAATFDVIIVNLPDPRTAQVNRFYTLEFFRDAAARLTERGVLALRLTGAENYISPDLAALLRSLHKTLRAVFSETAFIPGDPVHLFGARRAGVLATSATEMAARWRSRGLPTTYVNDTLIPFRMAPDRMEELAARIAPDAATPLNRDFAPVAYYFHVTLWSGRFNARYAALFRALGGVPFAAVAAALLALLAVLAGATRRRPRAGAAFCAAAMGFQLLGLEVLILLAFQALCGSVYHDLAFVIAAFMGGMAAGSWLSVRANVADAPRALALAQVWAALGALAVYGVCEVAARSANLFVASRILFPALAAAAGLLGGWQFPLANRVFFAARGRNLGAIYAFDLAGACLGALLFSVWLIPVFGLLKTALVAALVSLAPSVAVLRER